MVLKVLQSGRCQASAITALCSCQILSNPGVSGLPPRRWPCLDIVVNSMPRFSSQSWAVASRITNTEPGPKKLKVCSHILWQNQASLGSMLSSFTKEGWIIHPGHKERRVVACQVPGFPQACPLNPTTLVRNLFWLQGFKLGGKAWFAY